ncbi:MAG TPA: TIGR03619 family F420-dependent LLM class oxidoreductase [Acidimicrobiales bacterium]|nr:TIGR03619 family F420-dependent LLM class oxidoreductase [Acidimicrobiales bacterium]
MRFTVTLPTDRVDRKEEFLSAPAVSEMAAAMEAAGIDACHVTDHPFPPREFVESGGHHSMDPMVTLAVAASATTGLRLHTHVLIPAYRNPFVAAKAISTLAELSGGRVILGVAAGYLEGEFAACGAGFERRGERLESTLEAMRAAWKGDPIEASGPGWEALGNVMRPIPDEHIPVWIGGNSLSALRRAVRIGDGWCPFPVSQRTASVLRTRSMSTPDDLRSAIDMLRDQCEEAGRITLPIVCLTPFSHPHHRQVFDPAQLVEEALELEEIGVDWLSIRLPGEDRAAFLANVHRFEQEVVAKLR